jgi:hypothetical protein
MKAVDFIVELEDRTLFIEFKDPEHSGGKRADRKKFVEKFLSGRIDEDLKYKYQDSLLYQWAAGKLKKPIFYFVLVALESLSAPELMARTDELRRILPVTGPPSGEWKKPIVSGCAVFTIETWNRHLPEYPVSRRLSRAGDGALSDGPDEVPRVSD